MKKIRVYRGLIFLLWHHLVIQGGCKNLDGEPIPSKQLTINKFPKEVPISEWLDATKALENKVENTKRTHFQYRQASLFPLNHNTRRQFQQRQRRKKNNKRKSRGKLTRTRKMLQMSLMALTVLAFGTMLVGVFIKNSRILRLRQPTVVHNIMLKTSQSKL